MRSSEPLPRRARSPCRGDDARTTGAGDFAQAMMDLGATICRPRSPACGRCPLAAHCARVCLRQLRRPSRPLRRSGCARNAMAPPGGSSAMDMSGWSAGRHGPAWRHGGASRQRLDRRSAASASTRSAKVRHVFTHFALDLAIEPRAEPAGEGWWQPLDRLDEAGLPTLYRRAADLALSLPDRLAA